jgi:hypothetical protein
VSGVKRYEPVQVLWDNSTASGEVREDPEGSYILHADYAALEASYVRTVERDGERMAALEADLAAARAGAASFGKRSDEIQDELSATIASFRARVEAFRFLEMQAREAVALLRNGTSYEKMHVASVLSAALDKIDVARVAPADGEAVPRG